ncbi:MAG: dihydroorotate dehydrogenase electron transfer subunit [Deltaproteobacteria bacterium]|nr:dihydroorotate dehydrogenase electron transfer subunit [Deltaproteobacteria bacterium]
MMTVCKAVAAGNVASNRELIDGHFLMNVKLPLSLERPLPGQFLMVRIRGRREPFLGRPLSVYEFQRHVKNVTCEFLYRVVGKGTQFLSQLRLGDAVDVLGPLGRPFEIYPPNRKIVLIAGGMGIVPMTYLAGHYRSSGAGRNMKIICYAGAQNADALVGIERMQTCSDTRISTDDGSRGYSGLVTDLFARDLRTYDPRETAIFACGPRPMMKQLAVMLKDKSFPCQVSVEERMACGVGVCLGCVTAVKDDWGKRQYKRVCKEGPVFNIQDLIWD